MLLDEITDLDFEDLLKVFQCLFPKLMNCELKEALGNFRTQSVTSILEKNIALFSNPQLISMSSEKLQIFALSISMLVQDLTKEHLCRTCVVCEKIFDFTLLQCQKKCCAYVCPICIVHQITTNDNRCMGIGCMSSYDIHLLPINDQKRYHEKHYARNVLVKRVNEGLFLCKCNDEFFKPETSTADLGFVQCPRCDLKLCITCGFDHEEGFCASLINTALAGVANVELFKPCPKCSTIIQKEEGCLHVTCRQCKHTFCYSCGTP